MARPATAPPARPMRGQHAAAAGGLRWHGARRRRGRPGHRRARPRGHRPPAAADPRAAGGAAGRRPPRLRDDRRLRLARPRRLNAPRLARLLGEVRRPRRVAKASSSSRRARSTRPASEWWTSSMLAAGSPLSFRRCGTVSRRRSPGSTSGTRPTRAASRRGRRHRPHAVRARHRAIARVLVVVEEHADALLLPPLRRRAAGHPALDLAGEGERRAADLEELAGSMRTLMWIPREPEVFG